MIFQLVHEPCVHLVAVLGFVVDVSDARSDLVIAAGGDWSGSRVNLKSRYSCIIYVESLHINSFHACYSFTLSRQQSISQ